MTDILAAYLSEVAATHATHAHVAETSFYPALANLLNAVGATLSPKVRCVINLKNSGGGIPDGGLFTADQLRRYGRKTEEAVDSPFLDQTPARGVIEAKAPAEAIDEIVAGEQVGRYWKTYGLVLVTNFRAFALVGRNAAGQPAVLESFFLAESDEAFWRLAAHPQAATNAPGRGSAGPLNARTGERFVEYLRRALMHNAPLARPEDLAAILASYARDARARIEDADLPALNGLRQALEETLGLHFVGDKGEHFFRSTLVQTLFYGVFSAWATWARRRMLAASGAAPSFGKSLRESAAPYGSQAKHFDWRMADWHLRVPMIRALFEQIATPSKLGPLGLVEVLDWTAASLNRVDSTAFFAAFDEGHAIQYFYEPFLQAFDPELRKDLGVWYTPEEIVTYQVERVDRVLRDELGIADGLADPSVVVLDPCGTGTYLRAVLHRIAATLREKGGDALLAHDLKQAAVERVYGFEILPAPFVISHLQLGLLLDTLGAPLSDAKAERVGVYLTNALTGWEPPKEKPKQQILFPELAEERDAAEHVKQKRPILVILGNPPYNAFAGISPEEENGLVEPYKRGLASEWGIKKFNLDDLYVRFFRLAEKCIAERGGRGVVSFISNHSWIGDPSFVVMRRRFLDEFDAVWVDGMNGDSRETGKLTPDGKPDPSAFSTDWSREGIRVGTAIALLVKRDKRRKSRPGAATQGAGPEVRSRQFWGVTKRADLLASLNAPDFDAQYERAEPRADNRWSFRPSDVSSAYLRWPTAVELCAAAPISGLQEMRKGALMSLDRVGLAARMERYFDAETRWEDLCLPGICDDGGRYQAREVRAKLLKATSYSHGMIRRYALYPFDTRWCYHTNARPLWNEPRPALAAQGWPGNRFLVTRMMAERPNEGAFIGMTEALPDYHLLRPNAVAIPLRLQTAASPGAGSDAPALPGMEHGANQITANLSPPTRAYLGSLGLPDPDGDQETAELVWMHALAIGYSPAYLSENADGIRQDWPRIPLPAGKAALADSATLGRQVAVLLNTETPVPGVTAGRIRDHLKPIAIFARVDGKPARPDDGDLDLTAGWGHAGKGGVTMPGKGKIDERPDGSLDVYLNDVACWRNVPRAVWEYTIGGYQVIKKWLSYREKDLLGRGLTPDEVRYVTEMARRLAALVALQPALDDNCRRITADTHPWPRRDAK